MAEFTVRAGDAVGAEVYEGPFGPAEIVRTQPPDLTLTLRGARLPESTLELGAYRWLARRIKKTKTRGPFIAHVGGAEVAIQNQRFFCVPGFGRNPTLVADGLNRRYLFPIRSSEIGRSSGRTGRSSRPCESDARSMMAATPLMSRSFFCSERWL